VCASIRFVHVETINKGVEWAKNLNIIWRKNVFRIFFNFVIIYKDVRYRLEAVLLL